MMIKFKMDFYRFYIPGKKYLILRPGDMFAVVYTGA